MLFNNCTKLLLFGKLFFFDKPDAELYFLLVFRKFDKQTKSAVIPCYEIFFILRQISCHNGIWGIFCFYNLISSHPKMYRKLSVFVFFWARKALNSWNMRNLLSLGLESYISWNGRNFFLTKHKKFFNLWARKFHFSKYEFFLNFRLKKFFRKGFFYYYYLSLENSLLE